MAVSSDTLTERPAAESPCKLNNDQVVRASSALLKHIHSEEKRKAAESTTKQLPLGDADDSEGDDEDGPSGEAPVWLVLTTKKHVVDKNRLKPGKISVPHSLNTSSALNICLITTDPQRAVKETVAAPAFPSSLSSRITRVIGYSKLKDRYKSFESRRQLLSEHDIFLADDRIILRLVQTLGKIFFKSSKRPIPVSIEEIQKVGGKRVKKDQKKRPATDEQYAGVASPEVVAKEIERTLSSVPVNLAPATTAAVRVGWSRFTSDQLAENIDTVVRGMTDKFVAKGWKNVKAIHIKGANTMALPIWLSDELWVEDEDVLENDDTTTKAIEGGKKNNKKRKSGGDAKDANSKRSKLTEKDGDEEDAELIAKRRAKLQAQKAKAVSDADAEAASKSPAVKSNGASGHKNKKKK